MISQLKSWAGVLLYDLLRYERALNSSTDSWQYLCNRNEQVSTESGGVICNWRWSTQLHAVNHIPAWGRRLMTRALYRFPIRLSDSPDCDKGKPLVSIIIGHRGEERLPILLQTLRSFAGQRDVRFECIVLEESLEASIHTDLPDWVRFVHLPTNAVEQPFNRSRVFNAGAKLAKGELLILHDNDMIVADCYVHDNWVKYCEGFDVINLKRFIFYLTREHTDEICFLLSLSARSPEFVLQNLTGGGSLAIGKDSFETIGGFDEGFVGWGGEDVEFWDRAQILNVWNTGYLPILHLWHLPQPEKNDKKDSSAMRRLDDVSNIPVEERIRLLKDKYTDNLHVY